MLVSLLQACAPLVFSSYSAHGLSCAACFQFHELDLSWVLLGPTIPANFVRFLSRIS